MDHDVGDGLSPIFLGSRCSSSAVPHVAYGSGLQPPRARDSFRTRRILCARSGWLQALVGPLPRSHCLFASNQFCNCWNQTLWYDHHSLTASAERCLILCNRLIVGLFFVMSQNSLDSRFIPTCRKFTFLCHLLFSYSPTIGLQRLTDEFICCNHENAVRFRISHVYSPQISSAVALSDGYSRIS